MKIKNLLELKVNEKVILFDSLLNTLDEINKDSGRCIGTIQIIEWIYEDAYKFKFFECPHCGNRIQKIKR